MGSCYPIVLPLASLGGFPVSVNYFFTKMYALDQALEEKMQWKRRARNLEGTAAGQACDY